MITGRWRISSQLYDPFNKSRERTIRNTPKTTYNCAGYALECFNWYEPAEESRPWESPFSFSNEKEAREKTSKAVEIMLKDFSGLRVVESLKEVRRDEYAILFRLSSDGDFHYLKRCANNRWFHKRGSCKEIERMKKEDIFKKWNGRYNGPIVIFAKTKNTLS